MWVAGSPPMAWRSRWGVRPEVGRSQAQEAAGGRATEQAVVRVAMGRGEAMSARLVAREKARATERVGALATVRAMALSAQPEVKVEAPG